MIKEILKQAFILKNHRHYKRAIELFYKALEFDNESSELLLEIANLYYKLGNLEKSLFYIEDILSREPQHIQTLKLLKEIFMQKKAYPEAEQTAKNIYCVSNDSSDLLEILKILNVEGKYSEVFDYDVENAASEIYYEQAKSLFYRNLREDCSKLLEQVLILYPDNQDLLILYAQTCYAKNDIVSSENIIQKIKPDDSNSNYLMLKGLIDYNVGDFRKCEKNILQAIKLEPLNDRYYYSLANIYFKENLIDLAKKYYNHAISLNYENYTYHLALANLYYHQKQYNNALSELNYDILEAKILKVIIFYDTKNYAFAKQILDELVIKYPENAIIQDYNNKIKEALGLN